MNRLTASNQTLQNAPSEPSAAAWRLAACAVLLALALCEAGARLFLDGEWTEPVNDPGLFRASAIPGLDYEMTPGFQGKYIRNRVKIGSLGLRGLDRSFKKPDGAFRIVVLGDSCTFGYGVKEGETFPSRLEEALKRGKPGKTIRSYEVVNAGVSGYNAYNEIAWHERRGRLFAPDVVVVYFTPDDIFSADDPRLLGILAAHRPGFFLNQFLAPRSFFYNYLAQRLRTYAASQNRWDSYEALLGDAYRPGSPWLIRYEEAMTAFKKSLDEDGAALVVAAGPVEAAPEGLSEIERIARSIGAVFFNPNARMRSGSGWNIEPLNPHPSSKSYRKIAGELFEKMKTSGLFERRPVPGIRVAEWVFSDRRALTDWPGHSPHFQPRPNAEGFGFLSTGSDPHLISAETNFSADGLKAAEIELSIDRAEGTGARFYWAADAPGAFSEERSAGFQIVPDGTVRRYRIFFDREKSPPQTDRINGIRLDPLDSPGEGTIRSVRLFFERREEPR